jgi:hypothetical protein
MHIPTKAEPMVRTRPLVTARSLRAGLLAARLSERRLYSNCPGAGGAADPPEMGIGSATGSDRANGPARRASRQAAVRHHRFRAQRSNRPRTRHRVGRGPDAAWPLATQNRAPEREHRITPGADIERTPNGI